MTGCVDEEDEEEDDDDDDDEEDAGEDTVLEGALGAPAVMALPLGTVNVISSTVL